MVVRSCLQRASDRMGWPECIRHLVDILHCSLARSLRTSRDPVLRTASALG